MQALTVQIYRQQSTNAEVHVNEGHINWGRGVWGAKEGEVILSNHSMRASFTTMQAVTAQIYRQQSITNSVKNVSSLVLVNGRVAGGVGGGGIWANHFLDAGSALCSLRPMFLQLLSSRVDGLDLDL